MDLIIVITCSIAIAALCLLVLVRNPTQADNQRFALVGASLVCWTVANYFSDNATTSNLLFTRLTFIGGIATVSSFILFVSNFPTKAVLGKNIGTYLHPALSLALIPIALSPMFISGVSLEGGQHGTIHTAELYPVFVAYLLYSLALLFIIRQKQYKNAASRTQKQQISLLFGGIIVYGIFATLSNVLIPLAIDDWSSSRYGPLFTLIFVALIAYAIVSSRLFDIHAFAVRAAVYLSTVFLVGIFCVAPVVLIFGYFLGYDPGLAEFTVVVILSVMVSYLLQYLRNLFDRLTKRVFYRNYYEPQDVLERLSDILVRVTEREQLRSRCIELINEVMRPNYVEFSLLNTDSSESAETLLKDGANMYVADSDSGASAGIADYLRRNKIAVAIKLRTKHENIGYLILGYKRSGELYSTRDLQLLSTAADEIAISLQNALRFEEIERFNETLQQKITDATQRLSAANRKLKELNESKDDFIGMASHQLRTPLTSVKGYVSLVMDGDAGPVNDSQRQLLQQAFVSSQRMVYLIADLLNISRLKTGKFVVERTPTRLDKLISDELAQLKETAEARQLELIYYPPKDFPELPLDETKTRQVIMNFIDNAIYYTPAGGHINVELRDLPSSVELRVSDDGIGVPVSERHHLFTKFYRAKNAQKARPDGTGLGLFMAKKVIVAQGGAIIFETKEGEGSTFGFSFPKDLPVEGAAGQSAIQETAAGRGPVAAGK